MVEPVTPVRLSSLYGDQTSVNGRTSSAVRSREDPECSEDLAGSDEEDEQLNRNAQ